MKKRVKAFVKVGTVVMMSACIAFSNINASILVNAEENQGEHVFYEDDTEVIEESTEPEQTETTETEETEPEQTETEETEPEETESEETEPEQTETTETEEAETEETETEEAETEETEETETEEPEETILVQTELKQTVNNTTISISGNLPEDIELVVTELEDDRVIKNSIEEKLTGNATVTVYKSFDITLMLKGEEYEPESDNNSVVVTIKCEDNIEDNSTVFHTDNNNTTTEVSSTINAETNTVEFMAESFSVYTIASVTYDTDTGTEYSNDYGTGYYFIESKTLLVTSAGTATPSNNRDYPWYEINENIEKVIITSDAGSIGNYEFSGYRNIKEVIIEEGVTSIGIRAFWGCSSLQELIIPNGVTKIEERTFADCSSLNHLVIPSTVTSISDWYTFSGCSNLISASPISENRGTGYEYGWTDIIPANAFLSLDKLKEISLINTITTIGNSVFNGCSSIQEIIIPDGATKIGDRAFQNCKSLNHIVMPSSVTDISGYYTFSGCTSLVSASPISENRGTGYEYGWADKIPANAFLDLNKLQEISLIDTITTIGASAFSGCSSLQELIIPEGVTTIGASAFNGCSSLQELIIPEGITKIEDRTFAGCSSLNHLLIPLSVTNISDYYTFSGCNSLTTASPLSENKGTGYEYGWTETIPSYAFLGLDKLQTVSILDTITTIGIRVFMSCSSLQEVIIPEGVTKIGERTFVDCSSLNHLVMPASVTDISDWYTFSGCNSLTSVSPISEGKGTGYEYGWTDAIPANSFKDLNKLQTASILDTITTIGSRAFENCQSLQEINIPDSVNSIGWRTFIDCNKLITFKIGNGIKTIDSDAFRLSNRTDTTVYTDNKVVKKYNWSGDNRNVIFMRLNPITDLDIVIPVNNMSFNIDGEKNFSSDKVKIVNNSPCDVDIFVKNINGENNTVSIVPENTYTDEEWKALTDFNSIAFMLNNTDLAIAYNNSENDESKFINLGKLKSVESEDEVDPSSYTFTTYSASTAKANGRASISSGKAGYVGNGADNYVYWTINVDKTGKYCFGVNGAVSGTRTTYIDANGVNVGSVTHQGNSWSTGFDVYTTVELQAGENIIKLYNNSGYAPDIYNIQLSNEFVTDNTFDLQLEAKYPKSYEIDTDLEMNYNLTLLFVSKEN